MMMKYMAKRLRNKDGISTVFFAMFTVFFVAFLGVVLDIGQGYVYKQQIQAVADSVSIAAANYGSEVVYNDFGGTEEGRIRIDSSKAKTKAESLLRENLKNTPIKNYDIIYNFSNKLSSTRQDILWGAGVLRIEIVGKVPRFIGAGYMDIRSVSMTVLTKTPTSTNIVDHNVKVTANNIKIYNKNNLLILDQALD